MSNRAKRKLVGFAGAFICALVCLASLTAESQQESNVQHEVVKGNPLEGKKIKMLQDAFLDHSGAKLVFNEKSLPGKFYDKLPVLKPKRQIEAARILLREVKKLPKNYLKDIKFTTYGVFAACVSKKNDGYHSYDKEHGGYVYFGMYNGQGAAVGAYYNAGQLPLTFHHEIFHHIDSCHKGTHNRSKNFDSDDKKFKAALKGVEKYPKPKMNSSIYKKLKKLSSGYVLKGAVSDYCKKNTGEDQAETARYLMSHLPESLVQLVEHPEYAGSQRLLHVLAQYKIAAVKGPGIDWFAKMVLAQNCSNHYIDKVDDEVSSTSVRVAIRRVQPSCVRFSNASGVNLTPDGYVLTAGHVAGALGVKKSVLFPDGQRFSGTCIAFNKKWDLAVVKLNEVKGLVFAPLSKESPVTGTDVVCIGQPGTRTPGGEATGYKPFCVSTGSIRGFLKDPLGSQRLGRTKHDAWTYWGHSGSPLFDHRGRIVSIHNSWDSSTAMRHGVTHQAIVKFLKDNKVPFFVN